MIIIKLKFNNGTHVNLPSDMHYEDRLLFVEWLLKEFPEQFSYTDGKMFVSKYSSRLDVDRIVKVRLDILATWLIRGIEGYNSDVMTQYKKYDRQNREIVFSRFREMIIQNEGWY